MRTLRFFAFASLFVSCIAIMPSVVLGQDAADGFDWQTLKPAGEEFSVRMPKDPTFESGKMPYHRMELNTRLYLSQKPNGPVLAIVSLSGIKSNPALYSELERVNSYVDAFKKFLAPRLKGKTAVAKLTLVGNRNLNGHEGREYKMSIGDLSGTAQVFGTRRRFYAIAYLDNKKNDELQEQFLSSFYLPDKVVAPPPTVAEQGVKPEVALPAEVGKTDPGQTDPTKPEAGKPDTQASSEKPNEAPVAETKVPESPADAGKRKPISGGVLNGRALMLPKPDYPPEARTAKAAGSVAVQVTIDEYGTVISAQAVNGHPLLRQASVNAAYLARFSPTMLMGEPVKVTGIIMYNFVAQ